MMILGRIWELLQPLRNAVHTLQSYTDFEASRIETSHMSLQQQHSNGLKAELESFLHFRTPQVKSFTFTGK
jgi:hypothetical protein